MKRINLLPIKFPFLLLIFTSLISCTKTLENAPTNILFIMSDDQSWMDVGVYGCEQVQTPSFDRLASEGALFTNVFATAPGCAPSRASILTGRFPWELEEAGTHFSNFPRKLQVYPDVLEANGYEVGFTGKGWGPGNYEITGWEHNPAGPEFNDILWDSVPFTGIHEIDCASNFGEFLKTRDQEKPFAMWIGSREPHGPREIGSGIREGKNPDDAVIAGFIPDTPETRRDMLDYYIEIEFFDSQLGIILADLEESGEMENTLIVVTGDNGMPFPRAKANLYEYGIHEPMVVKWPGKVKKGRVIDDLVSFADLAPTFLDVAGLNPPEEMSGKSFKNLLLSSEDGTIDPERKEVFSCMERHSHQRYDNLGYPMRSIRTQDYLYIRNFKPQRWPLGDSSIVWGNRRKYPETPDGQKLFEMTYGKRPAEELFNIKKDPFCLDNLAEKIEYSEVKADLRNRLDEKLTTLNDPRMNGYGDIFESYPRYGSMRDDLGGFNKEGEYNPEYQIQK